MRRFFADMNPTVRGFLIITVVVLVILVLSLEETVVSLHLIARIAFFIAIAVVLFMFWRERRSDIATWSRRGQLVFYGAAALAVGSLAWYFWPTGGPATGLDLLAFLATLAIAIFSMIRVWRDERTFGY
ncbi:MAG TPA: hypothetical protein VM290_03665 [Gaiellaceae bacterium]|jgi:cbb3-type cytochrome oxidase subunit 3|nr:hypothetical protein [Gaiellaceae bacterium]